MKIGQCRGSRESEPVYVSVATVSPLLLSPIPGQKGFCLINGTDRGDKL